MFHSQNHYRALYLLNRAQAKTRETTTQVPGFELSYIPGDGNCMYQAVLTVLQTAPEGKKIISELGSNPMLTLRSKIADILQMQLTNNTILYQRYLPHILQATGFTNPTAAINQYLRQVRTPGNWGDHLVLQTIAEHFNIMIQVYRPNNQAPFPPLGPAGTVTINLLLYGETHYDAYVPEGFNEEFDFELNADDTSSDEEEHNYDVISRWQEFAERFDIRGSHYKEDAKLHYQLSFLTYALALEIFGMPAVQSQYKQYKHTLLSDRAFLSREAREKWLDVAIRQNLAEIFALPQIVQDRTQWFVDDFLVTYHDFIEAFKKQILIRPRSFIKLFTKKNNDSLKSIFASYEWDKLIAEYIDSINTRPLSDMNYPLDDFEGVIDNENIRERLKSNQHSDLYNQILDEVSNLPRTPKGSCVSTKAKDVSNYKNRLNLDDIGKLIANLYQGFPRSRTPEDITTHVMDSVQAQEYLKNLIDESLEDLIANQQESPIWDQVYDLLLIEGFVQITYENLQEYFTNQVTTDFITELVGTLTELKAEIFADNQVTRPTLDTLHTFDLTTTQETDFFAQFLASLRLSNRSIKRAVKNRDEGYMGIEKESYARGWKFPASSKSVLDLHHTTCNNVRTDQTQSLGTYPTVLQILEDLKDKINKALLPDALQITDADIAYWLELILVGDDLKNFLYSTNRDSVPLSDKLLLDFTKHELAKIAYLMFGCEVVRNPGALIHHHMMLDLIRSNHWTWQQALDTTRVDAGYMPMAMKNATPAARALANEYHGYMPRPYRYDQKEDKNQELKTTLLARQFRLISDWLQLQDISFVGDESPAELRSIFQAMQCNILTHFTAQVDNIPELPGFVTRRIEGDGHCMYRAILTALGYAPNNITNLLGTDTNNHIANLRNLVANQLDCFMEHQTNAPAYDTTYNLMEQAAIQDGFDLAIDPIQHYLTQVRDSGWGDELVLRTIADLLETRIFVHHIDGTHTLVGRPEHTPIHVFHHAERHYDAYVQDFQTVENVMEIADETINMLEMQEIQERTALEEEITLQLTVIGTVEL